MTYLIFGFRLMSLQLTRHNIGNWNREWLWQSWMILHSLLGWILNNLAGLLAFFIAVALLNWMPEACLWMQINSNNIVLFIYGGIGSSLHICTLLVIGDPKLHKNVFILFLWHNVFKSSLSQHSFYKCSTNHVEESKQEVDIHKCENVCDWRPLSRIILS